MLKKIILFLFLYLLMASGQLVYGSVLSQTVTVIGQVVDKQTKTPLEFSSITFYAQKDSTILTGGITDQNGFFSILTYPGDIFIKIEFIGYKSVTVKNVTLKEGQKVLNLGIITLSPNINLMEEIEVRASRSSVMVKLDKRVFNVGTDLTATSGTAEDILRNVPGVSVNVDGKVTMRNSKGVLILLNGRPSALLDENNSLGLRQIQSEQIDRIEVITNPSSRYEAEGTAGIINIILKNYQSKGLNGSVNVNAGYPENFGVGGNLNYHKNRLNGYVNLGTWYVNRPGTGSYRNEFYNLEYPDSTILSNMDRTHERRSLVHFAKLGLDFYCTPKSIFMSSLSYRSSSDNNRSNLIYKDRYSFADVPFSKTERQEKETEEEVDWNYLLTYKRLFERKGQQLTADFQYEKQTEEEVSFYDEFFLDQNNQPIDTAEFHQLSNNEEGTQLVILKSDYIHPLQGEAKCEVGAQSSFRTIGNNYRVRELMNDVEVPDTNFTNNFKYNEAIYAGYLNYSNKIDQFSFQLGLRVEHSEVETNLLLSNVQKKKKRNNVFPSVFLTYDLPDNQSVQLSYSRRIKRPGFSDLNPFFTFRDRRNIFRGNPQINPELTDSYELGHVKYWKNGSLSSIAYFRNTDNVIKRIQRIDKNYPERTITQAENLDFKRNFGIEFTGFFSVNKWWRLHGDINIYHSFSEGSFIYGDELYFVSGKSFSMSAKTSSRFTFWKKVNTQVTLSYDAPRRTTQGINKSTTVLDLASSIDILKNKGSITLGVTDLFNTRRRRSVSSDETFRSEDNFLWQSRAVILSFHYRFNQQKNDRQIYTNPNEEDEDEIF